MIKAFKKNITLSQIYSIIVCYKPNLENFKKILLNHDENFKNIIIINNSPEISLESFKSTKVKIINNKFNVGLAAALNIGILKAKKSGADMVALFDQDTILDNSFSLNMLKYINFLNNNVNVNAVYAPSYFNKITNSYGPIINFTFLRLHRNIPSNREFIYKSNYVITSGSFIPMKVLDDIGLMCEKLFIDFVDIEWCLRARAKGYEIVSFPQIEIEHHLGDSSVSFMGTNYPIHSPLRMYYYFRNAMYLYRLREIDWNWRLVDATRNLFRFLFYMLFVKNRPNYFKYIIKGYYHGLIKKMGKLEE